MACLFHLSRLKPVLQGLALNRSAEALHLALAFRCSSLVARYSLLATFFALSLAYNLQLTAPNSENKKAGD